MNVTLGHDYVYGAAKKGIKEHSNGRFASVYFLPPPHHLSFTWLIVLSVSFLLFPLGCFFDESLTRTIILFSDDMAKMIKFLEADKQLLDKLIELTMALNAYEETNSTDRQKSRQPMELNTNLNCWKDMQEKLSQQETQVNRNPDWVAPYNIESLAQSLGIDLPQAFSNNNSNCQTNFEQEKASSFMASSSGTSNLLILPPKSPTVRSCEKSYTEKVPVQSSAHVSFIVGKQGEP